MGKGHDLIGRYGYLSSPFLLTTEKVWPSYLVDLKWKEYMKRDKPQTKRKERNHINLQN